MKQLNCVNLSFVAARSLSGFSLSFVADAVFSVALNLRHFESLIVVLDRLDSVPRSGNRLVFMVRREGQKPSTTTCTKRVMTSRR
jgi:hypothetical protein